MAYHVQVVDMGCGATAIDPKNVELAANNMSNQGYELVQAYVDSTQSCCGSKKSLILIFRSRM